MCFSLFIPVSCLPEKCPFYAFLSVLWHCFQQLFLFLVSLGAQYFLMLLFFPPLPSSIHYSTSFPKHYHLVYLKKIQVKYWVFNCLIFTKHKLCDYSFFGIVSIYCYELLRVYSFTFKCLKIFLNQISLLLLLNTFFNSFYNSVQQMVN